MKNIFPPKKIGKNVKYLFSLTYCIFSLMKNSRILLSASAFSPLWYHIM